MERKLFWFTTPWAVLTVVLGLVLADMMYLWSSGWFHAKLALVIILLGFHIWCGKLMIGSTLSHYRIDAELGRGGMGVVYKATDTNLDRTVAIKVLPANALISENDRARFYREAKSAAALNHPNIAQVYQIDEAVPEGGKL